MNVVPMFPATSASQESQMLDLLIDGPMTAVVWSTDLDLRVTAARGSALRLAGIDLAPLVGRTLIDILACPESPDFLVRAHMRAVTGETVRVDLDWRGRTYAVQIVPFRDSSERIVGCLGGAVDASEHRRALRECEWLQRHDKVTRLANRGSFRETLNRALSKAKRSSETITIIHVSLDGFRDVNSVHGELAGDDALRAAGERLMSLAGAECFVARTGGDEFSILVIDSDGSEGRHALDRLACAFATPVHASGRDIRLMASLGSAVFPIDGETSADLMRAAAFALGRSKELGGNQVQRSSPSVRVPARKRLELATELQQAIERGELSLHYQPLIRLADGALVSMEALLRWDHGGQILPAAHFIRIAEESHLIVPIGNWVIDEACRQWAEWNDQGIAPARIAVNIGARHFHHPTLIDTVREALEHHGVPGTSLEIEITETTAMNQADATMHTFDQLRELGVEVTIDDFGTGHSSLSYLKRFAISALKIDRSFVTDLPSSTQATALVEAILTTARALGLRVVAEGVEQPRQAEWLRSAGCDDAQGYLFARPVGVDESSAYLRHCNRPGVIP